MYDGPQLAIPDWQSTKHYLPLLLKHHELMIDAGVAGKTDDNQPVSGDYFDCYGQYLPMLIHKQWLTPFVQEYLPSIPLVETYCYMRQYNKGAKLSFHKDRPAAEYSFSLCVSTQIIWSIWVEDEEFKLRPGDGVIYKGIQESHGRKEPAPDTLVQFFCHWVNRDGYHAEAAYDYGKNVSFYS